jgi:hypothetical protein
MISGNPVASPGDCEDQDELISSHRADGEGALAKTSFGFL